MSRTCLETAAVPSQGFCVCTYKREAAVDIREGISFGPLLINWSSFVNPAPEFGYSYTIFDIFVGPRFAIAKYSC